MISRALTCTTRETLDELHAVDTDEVTHFVHYTCLDVLFSILEPCGSKKGKNAGLRPYDTLHSNDPEEGMFVPKHWPRNPHWGWDIARDTDPTSDEAEKLSALSPAYTLSFVRSRSTKPMNDKLPLWKEYGNGCKGCSLSIPVTQFAQHEPYMTPYRVLYGPKRVKALFDNLDVKLLCPIMEITEDPIFNSEFRDEIGRMLRDALQPFRYLYKDKTYAHEDECRIVFTQNANSPEACEVVYESRLGMNGTTKLRHYPPKRVVGLRVLFHSDTQIRLGPLVPYKHNVTAVIEKLLRRYCEYAMDGDTSADPTPLHPPTVERSEIHYREN